MILDKKDLEDLRYAVNILENPSLAERLIQVAGMPARTMFETLPESIAHTVHETSRKAMEKALNLAIRTLPSLPSDGKQSANSTHRMLSGISGAVGGFFGMPALAVELPITTLIILRSIADIAKEEGEDLLIPHARLACIEVFALGGGNRTDSDVDVNYYTVKATLASSVSQASRYIAQRRLIDQSAPVLARLVTKITSRFSAVVSQKLVAQAIPAIGALGGASINLIFMDHFQKQAKGHFTVRRLERKYGKEIVQIEYRRLSKIQDYSPGY